MYESTQLISEMEKTKQNLVSIILKSGYRMPYWIGIFDLASFLKIFILMRKLTVSFF